MDTKTQAPTAEAEKIDEDKPKESQDPQNSKSEEASPSKSQNSSTTTASSTNRPSKPSSGKMVICRVNLLDGSTFETEIEKNKNGVVLFDAVCKHLNIEEKEYFALSYIDSGVRFWLNNEKKISKQVKGGTWVFEFQVKFYPPEPSLLNDDITRYQLCLQIRVDVYNGKLPCSFVTHALLGSYTVQAEMSDYDPNDFEKDYLKGFDFAPANTPDLLEKIHELHKTHKGQTPEEAEIHFLENAKKLAMYGVDLHKAKDSDNVDIMLGVCASGLMVYRDKLRINRFVWPKIIKLSYKRNNFYIKVRPSDMDEFENTIRFKLLNHKMAKRLWKTCVEHHTFFRLKEAEPPKTGTLFPRFNSKFRYSGRTQKQLRDKNPLMDRPQKPFDRGQYKNKSMPLDSKAKSMDDVNDKYGKGYPDENDRLDHKGGVPTALSTVGPPPYRRDEEGYDKNSKSHMERGLEHPNQQHPLDATEDRRDRTLPHEDRTAETPGSHAGDTLGLQEGAPVSGRKGKKSKEDKEREKREKEEEKRRKKEEERRKKEEKDKKKHKPDDLSTTEDRTDKIGDPNATETLEGVPPGSVGLDSANVQLAYRKPETDKSSPTKEEGKDKYGQANDKYGPGHNKYGPEYNKYGPGYDNYGPEYGDKRYRPGSGDDKYGPGYGPESDRYGKHGPGSGDNRYGPDSDKYGPGHDSFGPGLGDKRYGPGSPGDDKYGPGYDNRYGPDSDKFGPGAGDDRYGPGYDKYGPGFDKYGPGHDDHDKNKHDKDKKDRDKKGDKDKKDKKGDHQKDKDKKGDDKHGGLFGKFGKKSHDKDKEPKSPRKDTENGINMTGPGISVVGYPPGVTMTDDQKEEEKEKTAELNTAEIVSESEKEPDELERTEEHIEVPPLVQIKVGSSSDVKVDKQEGELNQVEVKKEEAQDDNRSSRPIIPDENIEDEVFETESEQTDNSKVSEINYPHPVSVSEKVETSSNSESITEINIDNEVVETIESQIENVVESEVTQENSAQIENKDVEVDFDKYEIEKEISEVNSENVQIPDSTDIKVIPPVVIELTKDEENKPSEELIFTQKTQTEIIDEKVMPLEVKRVEAEVGVIKPDSTTEKESNPGDKQSEETKDETNPVVHEYNEDKNEKENVEVVEPKTENTSKESIKEQKEEIVEVIVPVPEVCVSGESEKNSEEVEKQSEEVEKSKEEDPKEKKKREREEKERQKQLKKEEDKRKKEEKQKEKERIKEEKKKEVERKKEEKRLAIEKKKEEKQKDKEKKEQEKKEKQLEKERKEQEKKDKANKKEEKKETVVLTSIEIEDDENIDKQEDNQEDNKGIQQTIVIEDKEKQETKESEENENKTLTFENTTTSETVLEKSEEQEVVPHQEIVINKQEQEIVTSSDDKQEVNNKQKNVDIGEQGESKAQHDIQESQIHEVNIIDTSRIRYIDESLNGNPEQEGDITVVTESENDKNEETNKSEEQSKSKKSKDKMKKEKPKKEKKEKKVKEKKEKKGKEKKEKKDEKDKSKNKGSDTSCFSFMKKGPKEDSDVEAEEEKKDQAEDLPKEPWPNESEEQQEVVEEPTVKEEVSPKQKGVGLGWALPGMQELQEKQAAKLKERQRSRSLSSASKSSSSSTASHREDEAPKAPLAADDSGAFGVEAGLLGRGEGDGAGAGEIPPEYYNSIDRKMQFIPVTPPTTETRNNQLSSGGQEEGESMPFFTPTGLENGSLGKKKPPPVPPKGSKPSSEEDRHLYTESNLPPTVATEGFKFEPGTDEPPISTTNVPIVKTQTRTVTYEKDGIPVATEDSILISSSSHTTRTQTIETTKSKTERDGVVETIVEQKVFLSEDGDDIDHDELLAAAIRSVTDMNPDLSVEKIEYMRQIEESDKK